MTETTSVLELVDLGFPWTGIDPFIMTVHHVDDYPEGTDALGPARNLLSGRNIGSDFSYQDGWSMYHGGIVPGFPQHPHRGFETVTVVRRGYVDHSDSLGATARYGEGDVQWLTTGSGIMHSEMFPLLDADGPNTLELFQIWLNLPADSKLVAPYFRIMSQNLEAENLFARITGNSAAKPGSVVNCSALPWKSGRQVKNTSPGLPIMFAMKVGAWSAMPKKVRP